MLGVDRQRCRVLVEGSIEVARPLLEDAPQRVVQGGLALVGDAGHRGLPFVERHEVLPALGLGIEALERRDRGRVDPGVEDLLVDGDGAAGVGQTLVREARLLEKQLLALRLVLGRVRAPLDDVEQRRVVAELPVERLEGSQHAPVVAAQVERLDEVLLGERGVAQGRPRDLGDPQRHVELDVAVQDVGRRSAQQLDELRVLARHRGEPLGALDPRRQLGVGDRFAQALGRERQGARGIGERPLGDPDRLRDRRELLRRGVGVGPVDLEHAQELLARAVCLVERAQDGGHRPARVGDLEHRFERRAALRVGRVERERLAVRLDRALDVREARKPHRAEAREDGELVVRRLGQRQVGLERVGQVAPAVADLVERGERRERPAVGAEVVDHGAVRHDGLVDVAELLGQRARDPHEEGAALVAVVGHPLSRPQDLDELAPALGALEQTVERRQRQRVVRVVVESSSFTSMRRISARRRLSVCA